MCYRSLFSFSVSSSVRLSFSRPLSPVQWLNPPNQSSGTRPTYLSFFAASASTQQLTHTHSELSASSFCPLLLFLPSCHLLIYTRFLSSSRLLLPTIAPFVHSPIWTANQHRLTHSSRSSVWTGDTKKHWDESRFDLSWGMKVGG